MFADHVRDPGLRDEAIGLLALYDADSTRRARWLAPGRLVVRAPPGAGLALDRLSVPVPLPRATNVADVSLAPGSYSLSVAMPGRVPVRAPIVIERGRTQDVDIALPPRADQVPDGFVYIPAGEFLYGNAIDEDRSTFFATTPQRLRWTQAFLISRTEVTFAQWLAYVDAQREDERARRLPGVPGKVSGSLKLDKDASGHWRLDFYLQDRHYLVPWGDKLVYIGRDHNAAQDWRNFPVLGVSGEDAAAYAAWLDRERIVPGARVCTEIEWERAARGADGRGYPATRAIEGNDANVDATYTRGWMGPDEVGLHPASRSPFGIDDTCGNAFEWTQSEEGGYILRSGSYQHDRRTAHLTNRSPMSSTQRDAAVGVRLCADPPLPR
jgi:formylglycine-generating enzyme required for sulfatase activity